MITQITMTVEEFTDIADNPIQRDTIGHAQARSRAGGHLSIANPTHAKVAIAQTKRGRQWKLDGHSRAYLWQTGDLETPPLLYVDVYEVKNIEEVVELYQTFDADTAVERPRDKLYGAFRFHDFIPQRPFMYQATGVITAMKLNIHPVKYSDARSLSIYDLVDPWIDTLKLIDTLDPFMNHFIFPSYITTAMMLSILRDGNKALSYWQEYHDGGGTRTKTSESAFYTARQAQRTIRADKENVGAHSYGMIRNTVPLFLWLYDQWSKDKRIANGARIHSKKFRATLPNLGLWWRTEIGDYFYPQIRTFTTDPDTKQEELILE